ncbi:hypothetical protein BSKO_01822 [Bryopsis sp. KO-2023]|nr:hypothetical protein BSKO_01822 [Bryopsis sp. KO-2023]
MGPKAARVVVANSDSDEEEDPEENVSQDEIEEVEAEQEALRRGRTVKISLSLKRGEKCKVCGSSAHRAGFQGATYIDCPNKPCYLCKVPGHTTATCPHRLDPGRDCRPSTDQNKEGIISLLAKRERDGKVRGVELPKTEWKVDCAILRLHHRRCQCLRFHPTKDDIVVSGDKSGELAVWNFMDVNERTVYSRHHKANTNGIRFIRDGDGMTCLTSSSDGTLKSIDIEVGKGDELLNLNEGDVQFWGKHWLQMVGIDIDHEKSLAVVGDSSGGLHFVDHRVPGELYNHRIHKNRVTSCDFNPRDNGVLLTCGNDHTAKILDIRKLGSEDGSWKEVTVLHHPRVVNNALFSPLTGRKIMTTCLDNRIRLWDDISRWDCDPDREIIHSHDFNRYLTPFQATWDPKDLLENQMMCGRYISENFNGVALHPVDMFDASNGRHLAEMVDPMLSTISPLSLFHPRLDYVVSGSSRALYMWCPKSEADKEEEEMASKKAKKDPMSKEALYRFFDAGVDNKKGKKK